jgi:hypothetical protein
MGRPNTQQVNLYLRPNVCLILREPLSKSETSNLMVDTLRDAGVLLDKQAPTTTASVRWPGTGESVSCFTMRPATAAGEASSAEIGGSGGGSGAASGIALQPGEAQLR